MTISYTKCLDDMNVISMLEISDSENSTFIIQKSILY